ncbi:alpha/beta fold hydrolase [Bacillus sp. 2205SS5-2]|uniref:alpha/beta fold hydrolase n=1 Tax=Bacillus sp. 2205SS5-2 TaxID=3109031 RepID=UPI003004292D
MSLENEFRDFPLLIFNGLAYRLFGDRSGYPVIYFHGTPGSSFEGLYLQTSALRQRILIIAIDREYFEKSRQEFYRHFAMKIRDLIQYLGLSHYSFLAWSAGSVASLKIASILNNEVESIHIWGGVPPLISDNIRPKLHSIDRFFHSFIHWNPAAFCFFLKGTKPLLKKKRLSQWMVKMYGGMVEWNSLQKHFYRKWSYAEIQTSIISNVFRMNVDNVYKDYYHYLAEERFDETDLPINLHLWHGQEDQIVPFRVDVLLISKLSFRIFTLLKERVILSTLIIWRSYFLPFFKLII